MPDYYAILWRALRKGDFQSVRWRESVFDQTRQMLRDQLRNTQPPMSPVDIRHHTEALESAINAIPGELAQGAAAAAEVAAPPTERRPGGRHIRRRGSPIAGRRVAQLAHSHLDRRGRRRRGGCGRRVCLHGFPARRTAATAQGAIAKRPIAAGERPTGASDQCPIAGGSHQRPIIARNERPITAQ